MTTWSHTRTPEVSGVRKILYFHWALAFLILSVALIGVLMLYSVAGGDSAQWATAQAIRFGVGFVMMFIVALIPIDFWQKLSIPIYIVALALLIIVQFVGISHGSAKRWLDLGVFIIQPSEVMKIALVLILAFYYDLLDEARISNPLWLIVPLILIALPFYLILQQPDLGTAVLLLAGGAVMIFIAGVSLWYFVAVLGAGIGLVFAIIMTKGSEYQLLKDYQYRRIETFLDPSSSPYDDGYHITQSKISLGSGGISGQGFMQGTQSRGNFLPEKHTDFIFAIWGEEFGFIGGLSLLVIYVTICVFCVIAAMRSADRFCSLLIVGITATFFFYFAVNMLMVMGLIPVVGVPLPFVSYGGSAMMVLLFSFGLIQSAHIHKTIR